jgi:micrococcal nuclease
MRRLMLLMALAAAGLALHGCARAFLPAQAAHGKTSSGLIVHVADGDTVLVAPNGGRPAVDVRLLGMDSPEKYATRYGSPDEGGSLAASAFMERFDGRRVVLISDPSQDAVDRYGRLLRYVQLPGGKDLGGAEVARGLAMPYLFRAPAQRYGRYRALAIRARAAQRGSWGPPCDGDFHSSLPGVQDGL